jgi:hypothetical protein
LHSWRWFPSKAAIGVLRYRIGVFSRWNDFIQRVSYQGTGSVHSTPGRSTTANWVYETQSATYRALISGGELTSVSVDGVSSTGRNPLKGRACARNPIREPRLPSMDRAGCYFWRLLKTFHRA